MEGHLQPLGIATVAGACSPATMDQGVWVRGCLSARRLFFLEAQSSPTRATGALQQCFLVCFPCPTWDRGPELTEEPTVSDKLSLL